MTHLFWDASALSKRYAPEHGSEIVKALFNLVSTSQMATTVLGYAETQAALVRKHNHGLLVKAVFDSATSALETEVLVSPRFALLGVEFDAVLTSIALIKRHNINASDAAILVTFLRYAQFLSQSGTRCLLIASDKRLIRAAEAEGMASLNPETIPARGTGGDRTRGERAHRYSRSATDD